jgi:hypothetical protein
MLAENIKMIGVEARLIRALKPFAHFDVEDFEAKPVCGLSIVNALRQSQPVPANLRMDAGPLRRNGTGCGQN